MQGIHRFRRSSLAFATILFSVLTATGLLAQTLYVYDFDSSIYLSTAVVDAKVASVDGGRARDLLSVEVLSSYKGDFKPGQTLSIAGTDLYRIPKAGRFNLGSIATGDRLVLFLVRKESDDRSYRSQSMATYRPLPGGVRLLRDGRLFNFSQADNPGPYVANIGSDDAPATGTTIELFRKQVAHSLIDTEKLARLVEAKPDQLDTARLLQLIADRTDESLDRYDYFTDRSCVRLAELQNPELLSRALAVAKAWHETSVLALGLATPQGRDYLLARIADENEMMPDRLRYSGVLGETGVIYRSKFTDVTANSWKVLVEPDQGNSQYLTRIAKLARANVAHTELCRSLIRRLTFNQNFRSENAAWLGDALLAFNELRGLYETKPVEDVQFAIEVAIGRDAEEYKKLRSPCGNYLSILSSGSHYWSPKSEKHWLRFEFEIAPLPTYSSNEVLPYVVLLNMQSHARHSLKAPIDPRAGVMGGGANRVVLPKDLPAGKYKVFLELRRDGHVISSGHYFTIDL